MRFLFCLLLLFSLNSIKAQELSYLPQQYLVLFKPQADLRTFIQDFSNWQGKNTLLDLGAPLVPDMDIYCLHYNNSLIHQADFLKALAAHPAVELAQFNHSIKMRSTIPNDFLFPSQWQYLNTGQGGGPAGTDIDADLAWDIAQGGLTAQGDTIVIAIIDDGAELNHPDLSANLWRNRFEIPNNGIDDDGNGYVDDYLGWNSNTMTDQVGVASAGVHGTPVAGIVGAIGNNGIGVTGVNWVVKLMIIRNNFNTNEANVLIAYGYALSQRKRYNASNGAQGAFVVATNASWGLDNGQPSQAPLWCAFYDTLGKYGILNVAATTNNNNNVDVVGDLPTTCPSDFLVSVTNLNRSGIRNGGFGVNHIDLGAFGDGVFTLNNGNGYGSFSGTSAASPHVAGAVGLIYSAVCEDFISFAKLYPAQAALQLKQFILNGVTPISSLANNTRSGGHLNLYNTLLLAQAACPSDSCFAVYQFQASLLPNQHIQLNWAGSSNADSVQIRYRFQGTSIWLGTYYSSQQSYLLTTTSTCKNYEIEISSRCGNIWSSPKSLVIATQGCCITPTGLSTNASYQTVLASWGSSSVAQNYCLRYRKVGLPLWDSLYTSNDSLLLTNLDSCAYYEWQLRRICSDSSSGFSASQFFATKGCQSCSSQNYCASTGQNTSLDWLEEFRLGSFSHRSGKSSGYMLYDSSFIQLSTGAIYPLTLIQGNNFQEAVRIWIDFNQDGDFEDWNELVYEGKFNFINTLQGSISIPNFINYGTTRLRIALQWNTYADNCSSFQNGEVEDYCLQILPTTAVELSKKPAAEPYIAPNPAQIGGLYYLHQIPAHTHLVRLIDFSGRVLWQQNIEVVDDNLALTVPNDLASGLYNLQLQGKWGIKSLLFRVQ